MSVLALALPHHLKVVDDHGRQGGGGVEQAAVHHQHTNVLGSHPYSRHKHGVHFSVLVCVCVRVCSCVRVCVYCGL